MPDFMVIDEIRASYMKFRISKQRLYTGDFGSFVHPDLFKPGVTVKTLNDPTGNMINNCLIGYNYLYLVLDKDLTKKTFTVAKKKNCLVCGAVIPAEGSPSNNWVSMVWSEGQCLLRCPQWTRTDRKTGSCIDLRSNSIMKNYDFSQKKTDPFVCGDTFLEEPTERCELFTSYAEDSKCNVKTCSSSDTARLCQADLFGKSFCQSCSTQLCEQNKYDPLTVKKCLNETICSFKFENNKFAIKDKSSTQQSASAIIKGNKAQYMDRFTLAFKDCIASELNINDKLGSINDTFANCKSCASTKIFMADEDLKFCFESPKHPNRNYNDRIQWITPNGIDMIGWIMSGAAIFMILSGVFLLGPLDCITIFFRFWELMQYCYIMGYYVDNSFISRLFFLQFNFVTFQIFGFKGFITKNLMKLLINKNEGLMLINANLRNLQKPDEFTQYKKTFTKYFEYQKVGLFILDAGAMLDIFIICLVLLLIFSFCFSFIAKRVSNKNPIVELLARYNQGLIPTFVLWFIIENLSIFIFFALGQIYMIPSKIGEIFNGVVFTNKVILYCFSTFFLMMLPMYVIGVALKLFKDDVALTRIKNLGFTKVGAAMRVLYPLSIIRRIMFTVYFIPSVNTSGNTIYPFLVVILEILELTILFFSKVYKHRIVTSLHIYGSFALILMSLILMVDKLLSGLNDKSQEQNDNRAIIDSYFRLREYIFILGCFITIFGYVFGVIWIIFVMRPKLLRKERNEMKQEDVRENDEISRELSNYMHDDIFDRKNIELAAL